MSLIHKLNNTHVNFPFFFSWFPYMPFRLYIFFYLLHYLHTACFNIQNHQCYDKQMSIIFVDYPGGSAGKESAYSEGVLGSIPGLGRSLFLHHGFFRGMFLMSISYLWIVPSPIQMCCSFVKKTWCVLCSFLLIFP